MRPSGFRFRAITLVPFSDSLPISYMALSTANTCYDCKWVRSDFFSPNYLPLNFIFSPNLRFCAITLVPFTNSLQISYMSYLQQIQVKFVNGLSPLESSFPCNNFSFHSPIHSQFHVWLYLQQIQLMIVNVSGPIFFSSNYLPLKLLFFFIARSGLNVIQC